MTGLAILEELLANQVLHARARRPRSKSGGGLLLRRGGLVSTQVCVVAPGVQGATATAGRWYDPDFVSVSPGVGEGSPTGSFGK